MPTATERARGVLRTTAVPRTKFAPTLPEPPTTKRYPDRTPQTGREPDVVAKAIRRLGRS